MKEFNLADVGIDLILSLILRSERLYLQKHKHTEAYEKNQITGDKNKKFNSV